MKEFRSCNEIKNDVNAASLENVYLEMHAMMSRFVKENHLETDCDNVGFEEILGGNVFVAENTEDFGKIEVDLEGNTLLTNAGTFDIAHLLPEASYAVLVRFTSDTGGATYFIPKDIYLMIPSVLFSIVISNSAQCMKTFVIAEEEVVVVDESKIELVN